MKLELGYHLLLEEKPGFLDQLLLHLQAGLDLESPFAEVQLHLLVRLELGYHLLLKEKPCFLDHLPSFQKADLCLGL